jgi:chromosome segregation ATPase
MFISKEEKELIQTRLNGYAKTMKEALVDISKLKAKVAELEANLEKAEKPPKPHKPTEQELKEELKKARQRAYGRAYYHRKREEEKNWKLVQELATQGKPNVSA